MTSKFNNLVNKVLEEADSHWTDYIPNWLAKPEYTHGARGRLKAAGDAMGVASLAIPGAGAARVGITAAGRAGKAAYGAQQLAKAQKLAKAAQVKAAASAGSRAALQQTARQGVQVVKGAPKAFVTGKATQGAVGAVQKAATKAPTAGKEIAKTVSSKLPKPKLPLPKPPTGSAGKSLKDYILKNPGPAAAALGGAAALGTLGYTLSKKKEKDNE